jgi:hypothetical protein
MAAIVVLPKALALCGEGRYKDRLRIISIKLRDVGELYGAGFARCQAGARHVGQAGLAGRPSLVFTHQFVIWIIAGSMNSKILRAGRQARRYSSTAGNVVDEMVLFARSTFRASPRLIG